MTPPVPPAPLQQTERGTPRTAQHPHQQARLARLFRHATDQPDDQHLRTLLSRYREVTPS